MTNLTMTLPFPPSVNHYWRHVVLGKPPKQRVTTLISKPGREYSESVAAQVLAEKTRLKIASYVAMTVLLSPPDRRRRDVDNYSKSLLDSLVKAGVLEDDSLVRDLRLVWGEVRKGGQAVVMIREIAQQAQGVLHE